MYFWGVENMMSAIWVALSKVSGVAGVTPGVQGEGRETGWFEGFRGVLFHQSQFHKPKVGRACYFVNCVLLYAESMFRGSGNSLFGFPCSSVPDC